MKLRYMIPGFSREWWERERSHEEMVEFMLFLKCLTLPFTLFEIIYNFVKKVKKRR